MGNSYGAVFTQVVIGGINVDFIAKGKTEKLVVSSLFSKHITDRKSVV